MDVLEGQIFCFSDVEVDTRLGCLRRAGGEQHLRQKSFQVLVYLLENRDRLVTKNELIDTIWRETAVTDGVLVQCIKEIRHTLGDDHNLPLYIKTVPKAGYRFIGKISELPESAVKLRAMDTVVQTEEVTRIEVEYEDEELLGAGVSHAPFAYQKAKNLLRTISIIVLLSAVGGFSLFYMSKYISGQQQASADIVLPSTPGKKSLAVMYFDNNSDNPELAWLREGLADMLITNLSRSPKLNILSRQQLQTLLERNGYENAGKLSFEIVSDLAKKSRAESFVAGSFASSGEAIRLDVKLYDTQTGDLKAVETSTIEKPDLIFAEIDRLALRLANKLDSMPFEHEDQAGLGLTMTANLEAYRYYSLAVNAAQSLHNKEAIDLLEKAVALDSQFAMAHARIGYIYAVTWGISDKAKPYLEKAFSLSDRLTEKDRLRIAAWYSIANLDYPNAIEFYRQIIMKYPTETESYLRLGNLLSGEEENEEAVKVFKQGLAIDSDASLLYNALGGLYSMLGRHDDAIAMHRQYVALAPNEPNAHDSLGLSYQWAGFYQQAIYEYRRAIALKPSFEVATIHLANAYFQTGQYRDAIELYKKYISISPSDFERARGYSAIAQVYRRLKKFNLANEAARQAIKKKDNYIGEVYLIAVEMGHKKGARQLEKKLFNGPSGSNRGRRILSRYKFYFRGILALEKNQTDEALAEMKKAVRHLPPTYDMDPLEDCLAQALLRLNRIDEAVAEYERILRLNPNYPLARFHVALALEKKGQNERARENYKLFLESWRDADTDIPEIIAARKSLSES